MGAAYAVLLGDDEASAEVALLRDMTTKVQEQIPLAALPTVLADRLHPRP